MIQGSKYSFVYPNTLIFFTGAPVSGKSTLTPLLTASIENCVMQPMDVVRLLSQEFELLKPKPQQNPFVFYGSTDAYTQIGNGSYSSDSLIRGFKEYSMAVTQLLFSLFAKLNPEDIENMIIEGVQLMPEIVAPFLNRSGNKLIVLTSTEEQIALNRQKVFGDNQRLHEKYSTDKLMLIQNELVDQSKKISKNKALVTQNIGSYEDTIQIILQFLVNSGSIKKQ